MPGLRERFWDKVIDHAAAKVVGFVFLVIAVFGVALWALSEYWVRRIAVAAVADALEARDERLAVGLEGVIDGKLADNVGALSAGILELDGRSQVKSFSFYAPRSHEGMLYIYVDGFVTADQPIRLVSSTGQIQNLPSVGTFLIPLDKITEPRTDSQSDAIRSVTAQGKPDTDPDSSFLSPERSFLEHVYTVSLHRSGPGDPRHMAPLRISYLVMVKPDLKYPKEP